MVGGHQPLPPPVTPIPFRQGPTELVVTTETHTKVNTEIEALLEDDFTGIAATKAFQVACAARQKSLGTCKQELADNIIVLKRKRGLPEGVMQFANDVRARLSDGMCILSMGSGKFDAASVLDALKRLGKDACGAGLWIRAVTARVEELARFADWAQVR